tara:strand:- start:248 stop:700 length:453 start_codon:yes stop_codon:yes gene_type:complete
MLFGNNDDENINDDDKLIHHNDDGNYSNITDDDMDINPTFFFMDIALFSLSIYSFYRFTKWCFFNFNEMSNDSSQNQRLITRSENPITLTKIKYKTDEENNYEEQCSICLDEFIENETLFQLDCHHYYHEKCLKGWLKNNRNCPICRVIV